MSPNLLYVAALWLIASTATGEKLLPKAHILFHRFMDDFGRQYADDNEMRMRFEIFKRTLQRIDELNAANEHAVFGITKWADLTDDERKSQLGGISKNLKDQYGVCNKTVNVTASGAPKAWDWEEQGAVTAVKHQGLCAACWAFSAIGAIEGQWAIKHKELLKFSVQQLVDCDDYDAGCFGGWMTTAFSHVIINDGVMLEKDYPYVGATEGCFFNQTKVKANFSSCNYYKLESEETLKELLYSQGPLSVGINGDDLGSYIKGIFTTCERGQATHGVLLVGYGEENGVPFWRFKNSWGKEFGEKGYFRVQRGSDQCGMMDSLIGSISV